MVASANLRPGSEKGPGTALNIARYCRSGLTASVSARLPEAALVPIFARATQGDMALARKPVLHEQDYVVSDAAIRLTVVVGERQFGSSIVFIDDDVVANGDVEDLSLGDGDKLEGKALVIYTLVTDIRRDVDDMAVTWILSGGAHRVSATATGTPAKKFGSQMFKAVFRFVSP